MNNAERYNAIVSSDNDYNFINYLATPNYKEMTQQLVQKVANMNELIEAITRIFSDAPEIKDMFANFLNTDNIAAINKFNLSYHKNILQERLEKYQDNTKIMAKYLWLKDYHNRICSESDDKDR